MRNIGEKTHLLIKGSFRSSLLNLISIFMAIIIIVEIVSLGFSKCVCVREREREGGREGERGVRDR